MDEFDYSIDHFDRPLCIECQETERNGHYKSKVTGKKQNDFEKPKSTRQAKALYTRLNKIGIKCVLEYYDGYKHIDIAILWAGLYIEVDGMHHRYSFDQRRADDWRDFFSSIDGFETIGVRNGEIENQLFEVADWIAQIARKRYYRGY
jgi:very-short-patch-repair endonuclease